MATRTVAGFAPAGLLFLALAPMAAAQPADTVAMRHDPSKYEIVVSATKTSRDVVEIPNAAHVVRGEDLRRRGARTLGDALQDVLGVDSGGGSDNGLRLPNIGMWGLKEFDALLVTLNGVPLGGPFNPSLAQIPIEEIDRIEVVKGPQGTLYGVSAFAGMVQVFTGPGEGKRGSISVGGGSFSDVHGSASVRQTFAGGTTLRAAGSLQRMDGWQDRTGSDLDHGAVSLEHPLGQGHVALDLVATRDTQKWGTPSPFDAGELVTGYSLDGNNAVGGARLDHHIYGATARLTFPVLASSRLESTSGATSDRQISVRSFTDFEAAVGDTVPSEGVAIRPLETTFFEDMRLVTSFEAGGHHEAVAGAAITWGETTAGGEGFDFDQVVGDPASIPDLGAIPPGDLRSFSDRRTFIGAYAHDEWSPIRQVTIGGGGRFDQTNEKLHAQAQEQAPGSPLEVADDSQTNSAWSGDLTALVRLAPAGSEVLDAANLYGGWKSSFKPAAPNLSEAEGAEILDPEWTHSLEVGFKARALSRQVAFDLSWFDMNFENMVVGIIGPDTLPELVNAGKERFKGVEVGLTLAPDAVHGLSLALGYAHHDARFVEFTFVTPGGTFRNVSGKKLELVPEELMNARLTYQSPHGVGVFAAVRHQGERPFNRRNTAFAKEYTEWDAGGWLEYRQFRLSVSGRNLSDDRHVVSESDIGDSQFYPAPPRRVVAELSAHY